MEDLQMVLNSLSPYVVISLTGDPSKSVYASMWGSRSPMPNVWINRYEAHDRKKIIVNIWDLPSNRDKNSIMIPEGSIDHTIIIVDYSFRAMVPSDTADKITDLVSKENPEKQTVIFVGENQNQGNDKKTCTSMGISYLQVKNKDDSRLPDLIKNISFQRYRARCYHVDKQISELLLNVKS